MRLDEHTIAVQCLLAVKEGFLVLFKLDVGGGPVSEDALVLLVL
jgi:hypothetical protein